MIQLGKRNRRCALIAVAALGVSADALAQDPPPAEPTPAPTAEPAPGTEPAPPPANLQPVMPAAPPVPVEPPKPVWPQVINPPGLLRFNDLFSFRPGFLLQFWAQANQDTTPKPNDDAGDFAKNLYMRRARFYMFGGIGDRIGYTLLWESANQGLAGNTAANGTTTKTFAPFAFNDAFLDFKVNKYISIQAGMMLLPFTRNILQSTSTYWTLDIASVSATYIAATQTNVLRDNGVEVKINAADNHFEARAMVSQGVKIGDPVGLAGDVTRTGGKNDPRFTGYLQYNFLDGDSGYVFNGQYFGRKAIAGVALGGDYQKTGDSNPYFALSATLFAAIPIHGANKEGGDEIGGQVEYLHFHNGRLPLAGATGIQKQDDLLIELGYYNKAAKLSVFGKFEGRFLATDQFIAPTIDYNTESTRIYAGGLKYFIAESFANLTLQYALQQAPNAPTTLATGGPLARNDASQITLQMQLAY